MQQSLFSEVHPVSGADNDMPDVLFQKTMLTGSQLQENGLNSHLSFDEIVPEHPSLEFLMFPSIIQ